MSEMKINAEQLRQVVAGHRLVGGTWDDGKGYMCLVGALTGATSVGECVTLGWPEWLVNLTTHLNDVLQKGREEFALEFLDAIEQRQSPIDEQVAREHTALCLDRCVGCEGDEDWRTECREVVINAANVLRSGRWLNDYEAAEAAGAAWAAEAAEAAGAAWAAEAAEAAGAAGAAWAARAARAAWAAWAAEAAEAAEIKQQRADLVRLIREDNSNE